MENCEQLTFSIDSLTPETLPLSRLSEYLKELASLYGSQEAVHFEGISSGSALLKVAIEDSAVEKVKSQLVLVKNGTPPSVEAHKAYLSLDRLLRSDNAIGKIYNSLGNNILEFPGRLNKPIENLTIVQSSSVDGIVIKIGGKDETIPVFVRDQEGKIVRCQIKGSTASKELSKHYLGSLLRLHGSGKWVRSMMGWSLELLTIQTWEPIDNSSAAEVLLDIANTSENGWSEIENPILEWRKIRGIE